MEELENYAEAVARLAPEFKELAQIATQLQAHFAQGLITAPLVPRAARLIMTLAASDMGDLLDDVQSGSGRAAMRAARSIVEHAVNMHTVLNVADADERYMEHLNEGPLLLEGLEIGSLVGERLWRSMKHSAHKAARVARPRWGRALAKYGNGFKRSWHPKNLHDRADEADLSGLYEFYRLASAVTHGSAAGAVGQFEFHEEDEVATYAVGKVPSLIPTAFAFGASAYLSLLTMLWDTFPDEADANNMAGSAVRLVVVNHMDAIAKAAQATTMRAKQQGHYTPFLAFTSRGMRRWYVAVTESPDVWFQAIVDDPDRETVELWIEPVIQAYLNHNEAILNAADMAAVQLPPMMSIRPDRTKWIPRDVMPVLWPAQDDGVWVVGEEVVDKIVLPSDITVEGVGLLADLVTALEPFPDDSSSQR